MIKNASIYTVTALVNSAIPFLLLPILTSYLSPGDYGKLSLMQALLVFVLPFISMGISGGVSVNFIKLGKEEFSSYVGTAVSLLGTITLVGIALSLLLGYFASGGLFGLPLFWIMLLPLWAFSQSIFVFTLSLIQAHENPVTYGFMQIGYTALNLGLTLFLVMVLLFGWEGRQYAILLSSVVFVFISLWKLRSMGLMIFAWGHAHIRDIFSFGLPLIPHALGGALLGMSDRILISQLIGQDALGGYAVAMQIASIVIVVGSALGQAWTPFFYRRISSESQQNSRELVKYTYMIFLFIALIVGAVMLLSSAIFSLLIDARYHENYKYAIWLALGCGFNALYFIISGYIFFHKKTHILSVLTVFTGLLSFTLNFFSISIFGLPGAVAVYVFTWFLFFIGAWIMANRIHPMPWFTFRKET